MRPQDLNNRTDEELLEELEKLDNPKMPSPLWETTKIWWFPFLCAIMLLICISVLSITTDSKMNDPKYKETVEFKQFLKVVKDEPFIITIDGKRYTVTIGEANGR